MVAGAVIGAAGAGVLGLGAPAAVVVAGGSSVGWRRWRGADRTAGGGRPPRGERGRGGGGGGGGVGGGQQEGGLVLDMGPVVGRQPGEAVADVLRIGADG